MTCVGTTTAMTAPPAWNDEIHHYVFTVHALIVEQRCLPAGLAVPAPAGLYSRQRPA